MKVEIQHKNLGFLEIDASGIDVNEGVVVLRDVNKVIIAIFPISELHAVQVPDLIVSKKTRDEEEEEENAV